MRFAFNNPSGTWHDFYGPTVQGISFVAFSITFGTANTARFYVNGEEFPALANYGTPHTTAPLTQNNPLWIGADNEAASGSVNFPFYGNIDDVRIYNRKLTKQEIRDIYNFTSRACN